jgi:hypothetical protein
MHRPVPSKPLEGSLFLCTNGVWKPVKAVFTPPNNLVLDGAVHKVAGARHHANAPKKQADYGIQLTLVSGAQLNVAASSGLEKYDWIERLTPKVRRAFQTMTISELIAVQQSLR